MFWGDVAVSEAKDSHLKKLAKKLPLIVRDEKTASGRVHVGSLRGVVIHGLVAELLSYTNIDSKFLFEINDFDPMDALPAYLDQAVYKPYLGFPLCRVPSPDGKAENYAEYFAEEFIGVIREAGFTPEFYRSSEAYIAGKYDPFIRTALEKAPLIREIYKRVSGSQKQEEWLPLNVLCEKCGKVSTTRAVEFDGEKVTYECGDFVEWTKGCGHKGKTSPFGGNAKLPWKVEWAAKFSVFDVDIEGGGKDHSTRGGSRDIADAISREVFLREPPQNIPYEFFNVKGRKMSSSKGAGTSAREIADLLPPELLRFLLVYRDPARVIDFVPDGDTVPALFDTYDTYAKKYWAGEHDDFARAFELSVWPWKGDWKKPLALARFSNVAYLVQMPHLDLIIELQKIERDNNAAFEKFSDREVAEIKRRAEYAKRWLTAYAPADHKFELQKTLPTTAKDLSSKQKEALGKVLLYVKKEGVGEGQKMHTALHEIKTSLGMEPKEFFSALYRILLDKESGPKAGWFLSVLPQDFLEKRLAEAAE